MDKPLEKMKFHYKEFFKGDRIRTLMFFYNIQDGFEHLDSSQVRIAVDISWTGFCVLNWDYLK